MVFRILFIIINTALITVTFQYKPFVITPWFLSSILFIQLLGIYHKKKHDDEKIIAYLESAIMDETSNTEPANKKGIYYKINRALDDIHKRFNLSNIENQERANLLNALLEHINIGLITFNIYGDVEIFNKSARNLLSKNYLSNIEDRDLFKPKDIKDLMDFDKKLKKIVEINENKSIYIESSNFTLLENPVRIVSIQNINKTLDEKEMDSWNVLIKTLNHEIMNSITPISSLASSALSLLDGGHDKDLVEAVETIERRSCNLLKFIENYRALSQIPKPGKELILVKNLTNRISLLMSPFVEESGSRLKCYTEDEQLMIFADLAQLEQILINLIKNSIEASASEITLKGETGGDGSIVLSVTDNGSGFSGESEHRAFVPFYTTKPDGSGLGLSIVRQIIHLHNGNVTLKTGVKGSRIELVIP